METAAYTISFILTVFICFGIPLLLIVWLIYQSVYYKSQKFQTCLKSVLFCHYRC